MSKTKFIKAGLAVSLSAAFLVLCLLSAKAIWNSILEAKKPLEMAELAQVMSEPDGAVSPQLSPDISALATSTGDKVPGFFNVVVVVRSPDISALATSTGDKVPGFFNVVVVSKEIRNRGDVPCFTLLRTVSVKGKEIKITYKELDKKAKTR